MEWSKLNIGISSLVIIYFSYLDHDPWRSPKRPYEQLCSVHKFKAATLVTFPQGIETQKRPKRINCEPSSNCIQFRIWIFFFRLDKSINLFIQKNKLYLKIIKELGFLFNLVFRQATIKKNMIWWFVGAYYL